MKIHNPPLPPFRKGGMSGFDRNVPRPAYPGIGGVPAYRQAGTALCGRPYLGAHSGAPPHLLMGYGHG
jgi:hypothetical protein